MYPDLTSTEVRHIMAVEWDEASAQCLHPDPLILTTTLEVKIVS